MTLLSGALRGHQRIALDTNILVYEFEGHARYSPITEAIFTWLSHPAHKAIVSTLSLAEMLVKPYQDQRSSLADSTYSLLTTYPNLVWVRPDEEMCSLAASLRAQYRLRLVDAVLAATALKSKSTIFLCNDVVFRKLRGIEVMLLDDFTDS